jgi:hypothetical protein
MLYVDKSPLTFQRRTPEITLVLLGLCSYSVSPDRISPFKELSHKVSRWQLRGSFANFFRLILWTR